MRIEKIILGGHVMKSTGIVRKVDELGRIVIPREIRNKFVIAEKDPLEIYVDGSSIILKKYEPNCIFCGNIDKRYEKADRYILAISKILQDNQNNKN